jgi:ribonuclease-3
VPAVPGTLRSAIEAAIGHHFADPRLLAGALAHASLQSTGRHARRLRIGNERLEFLGDRVLGLVIAEMLMARYPDEDEGGLSRRHAQLVRRETLAEIATAMGVGAWLGTVGGGASAPTPAVLADSLEALIGALYLDGGLAPAARFIAEHWQGRIETMAEAPRDAKTALQEWAQGRGLPLPAYRVLASSGPMHAPLFEVEVAVDAHAAERGEGASKRAAEQIAAARLLARLTEAGGG